MNDKKIEISIDYGIHKKIVYGNIGISIYQILCDNDVYIDAICGGKSVCGKCKIQVIKGDLVITDKDRYYFNEKELANGYRLACMAYPQKDCHIKIDGKQQDQSLDIIRNDQLSENCKAGEYGIAIDIGTITIVYQLMEIKTGGIIAQISEFNNNSMYGADVLSRIDAANKGMLSAMCKQLRKQLQMGISKLLEGDSYNKLVIAGNTTMIHILMGYSCECLGKYPFKPVTTKMLRLDATQLDIAKRKITVVILPGVSAFIGGDIVSGLSLIDFGLSDRKELFLDLGTNGEMAVSDGNGKIITTSAPAGPAFEGGSISCGTGSIAGAIESCTIENDNTYIKTINNIEPVGICGSGIIELLYELRKNYLVDETGLLVDKYFESGYMVYENFGKKISLTQKDIREIQKAKAAIAAGMDILLNSVNMEMAELDNIYISGNFGYHLNVKKAAGLGLFNKDLISKIKILGNTSLRGASNYLCGSTNEDILAAIINRTSEIYLSNEPNFSAKYLDKMYLEDISEID